MIYFDNIHPDFEPVPVDPSSVTGIRMRNNGTTLIWQLGRMDVITSTNFFDCCYAIGAAGLEKDEEKIQHPRQTNTGFHSR